MVALHYQNLRCANAAHAACVWLSMYVGERDDKMPDLYHIMII